jgi:hypothetical protein
MWASSSDISGWSHGMKQRQHTLTSLFFFFGTIRYVREIADFLQSGEKGITQGVTAHREERNWISWCVRLPHTYNLPEFQAPGSSAVAV